MTDKQFWDWLTQTGAIAIMSRMKARDNNSQLNEICKQVYLRELKERK